MIERTGSYVWDTLTPHLIVGTQTGSQGITQTVPEDLCLCYTCGWMTLSRYHEHIVEIVDAYIKDVI